MPNVNPQLLVWARETAGLSRDEAAKKLGLKTTKKATGDQRVALLETGELSPSSAMLQKMSKAYRRPLLAFYLSNPPPKANRGHDFRLLPQQHTKDEPLVDVMIRDVRARQSMVRSIIEDDEEPQKLVFIGSIQPTASVDELSGALKAIFGIDVAAYRKKPSVEAAFDYLRSRAEAAGVFVLLIGNLGTFHTNLDVGAFRGFALSDPLAPFVVINDQDAKSAWSFSLLHELAHLLLGETGISGFVSDSKVELLCNDAASMVLVTQEELIGIPDLAGKSLDADAEIISTFARPKKVSRSMVAYRLFKSGRISQQHWEGLSELFRREWIALRERQREKAKQQDNGPNYYAVKRHRIGPALLGFVERSMQSGVLTPVKAGKVLGVKPRSVGPLLIPQSRRVA